MLKIDSSNATASSNLLTFPTNTLRSVLQFVLAHFSAAPQTALKQAQVAGAAQQPVAEPYAPPFAVPQPSTSD